MWFQKKWETPKQSVTWCQKEGVMEKFSIPEKVFFLCSFFSMQLFLTHSPKKKRATLKIILLFSCKDVNQSLRMSCLSFKVTSNDFNYSELSFIHLIVKHFNLGFKDCRKVYTFHFSFHRKTNMTYRFFVLEVVPSP